MEASTYLIKTAIDKAVRARLLMGALHGGFNGVVPGMIGGGLTQALASRDPKELKADQVLDGADATVGGVFRGGAAGAFGGAAGGALGALAGGAIRPSRMSGLSSVGGVPGTKALSTDVRYAMPGLEVPGMQIGSRAGGAIGGAGASLFHGMGQKSRMQKAYKPGERTKEINEELRELPSAGHAAIGGGITGAALGTLTSKEFLDKMFGSGGPYEPLKRAIRSPNSLAGLATHKLPIGQAALAGGVIGAGTGALRNVLIRHLDKDRLQKAQSAGKKKPSKTDKDKGDK